MKFTGQVLNVIPVYLTTLGTTVMFSASRTAHYGHVTEMETRFATGTGKVSVVLLTRIAAASIASDDRIISHSSVIFSL